jgi:hypothetical protein
LTQAFRIYPILSDNTVTNYQPRPGNEDEFNHVYDLLSVRARWDVSGGPVRRLVDQSGQYVEFMNQLGIAGALP